MLLHRNNIPYFTPSITIDNKNRNIFKQCEMKPHTNRKAILVSQSYVANIKEVIHHAARQSITYTFISFPLSVFLCFVLVLVVIR